MRHWPQKVLQATEVPVFGAQHTNEQRRKRATRFSIFLASPDQLPVKASLDAHRRMFQMLWLQQVASCNRQLPVVPDCPTEAYIGRGISRHRKARQGADVAVIKIETDSLGQVKRRLHKYLVFRA